MTEKKEPERIYFATKEEWRSWLQKNHLKENKIAVIRYKKHTGKPSPSHQELMHEAICFGWIDTTVKRIDDEKYLINFSRRNEKSRWSDNTLSYGKKLIAEGRMSAEGLKHYKSGLLKPSLDFGVPKNPKMSKDFKRELEKKDLLEKFDKLSKSLKRMHLRWIEKAKLKETKDKRIKEIIESLKNNKKIW